MKTRDYLHKGQTLVEFALIPPLMALFLVAILDLGRAAYYYSAVYNAAREGARYGIVHTDQYGVVDSGICSKAQPIGMTTALSCELINPCISPMNEVCVEVDNTDPTNAYITVTVVYAFEPVTPLVTTILGTDSIPIASSAVMKIEPLPLLGP